MASDAPTTDFASFFEYLSRGTDLPPLLAFVLGAVAGNSTSPVSDQPQQLEHSLLVRVVNGGNTVVIQRGGSVGIESLLRQLSKDGHPPASKASIAAMPTVELKESCSECSICLDEFEVGGEAKQMPCGHLFHGDCVEKWLKVHGTCPVCRFKMPEEEDKSPEKKEDESGLAISFNILIATRNEDQDNEEDGDHTENYNLEARRKEFKDLEIRFFIFF